jgi:hypothetical protein
LAIAVMLSVGSLFDRDLQPGICSDPAEMRGLARHRSGSPQCSLPVWLIAEALVLIGFSVVALFPMWVAMMVLWFSLVAVLRWAQGLGIIDALRGSDQRAHLIAAAGFPVLATAWKFGQQELGLDDGGTANRAQHFLWAAAMVGVMLPILRRWWSGRAGWEQVVMAVGLVAFIGNGVEVVEFMAKMSRIGQEVMRDTVADLCVNVAGAATAAALFCRRWRRVGT